MVHHKFMIRNISRCHVANLAVFLLISILATGSVVSVAAGADCRQKQIRTEFLHDGEKIGRMSGGAYKKPATYLWSSSISPAVVDDSSSRPDMFASALTLYGTIIGVDVRITDLKNFILYTNKTIRKTIAQEKGRYFERKGYQNPLSDRLAEEFLELDRCGVIIFPDLEGRIQNIISVNFESGKAEFFLCQQYILLRSFGANVSYSDYSLGRVDRQAAFKFVLDIYSKFERNLPFKNTTCD